jgi:hypothetical protein
MKKGLLMLLIAVLAVASSCSKDAKINKRLDGEWKVVTIGGVAPAEGEYTFHFTKEYKSTGYGKIYLSWDNYLIFDAFTYSVLDQKITLMVYGSDWSDELAPPGPGPFILDPVEIWSVTKYEKDRMEMVDSNGDVWVLVWQRG